MVQVSLVEYIQNLLRQGYDAETIRSTLLNAGYSPYDVNMALRAAGAPVKKTISTKTLIIAFSVILALALIVLIVLRMSQPEPASLGFNVNLFSTEVGPGQDLIVNAEIQNPSGRKISGLIDYEVAGPAGKIVSKTESFSVERQTSIPTAISLPSAVPGSYSLVAILSYAGKTSQLSRSFKVVSKAVPAPEVLKERTVEAARAVQLTCPGGCEDFNFCTTDSCVSGVCVSSPVVPCCGNTVCEVGENVNNCQIDCSDRPVTPNEIIEKAKSAAGSDLSRAENICDSIVLRPYVDSCLADISAVSDSKSPCSAIVDSGKRDSCYMPFAYDGDFSVCSELTNPYMVNACTSLASLSGMNSTMSKSG